MIASTALSVEPTSRFSVSLLTAFTVLCLLTCRAAGHGMMCEPRQRGAYRSEKCGYDLPFPADPVTDYCAHCLNGGTVATVSAHLPRDGWKVFEPTKDFDGTADRAGLCGDAKGHSAHMVGGDFVPLRYGTVPMVAHYKTGGLVDFVAEIDTNHNGYFEFFLCDLDACHSNDIKADCFRKGHCHKLLRVKHPDCEDATQNTHYECGPIDEVYPGRWYLPCRNTGHVGVHIVGGPSGTMRYKLPEGVSCKHCVVQWYWATANSCAPRGLLEYMAAKKDPFGTTCESDGGGRGTYRRGMEACGGDKVPEEFWSCADVQVTRDGKSAGPVKAVGEKGPNAPPPNGTDDEDDSEEKEVRKNPQKVLTDAKKELEKDINATANEHPKRRREEEEAAHKGKCLLEGEVCDGGVPCCEVQQVCVFSASQSAFSCRFWWSLWEEVEYRQKHPRAQAEENDGDDDDGDGDDDNGSDENAE